jgi:hypothetical protein
LKRSPVLSGPRLRGDGAKPCYRAMLIVDCGKAGPDDQLASAVGSPVTEATG